jgi:hypothetical protein
MKTAAPIMIMMGAAFVIYRWTLTLTESIFNRQSAISSQQVVKGRSFG